MGVYSREILHGLADIEPQQRFLWCYRPHRFFRSFRQPLPSSCRRRLLLESRLPACDLFHGLNQRLPRARARRQVVTFHDLFVLTSEYSTPEFRARFSVQARAAAARADLVIAVSEFTASQVADLLRVGRDRIRVVGHGVHPSGEPPPPPDSRRKWILHVGAIQARKNIIRLVEAFEHLDPDWVLVLAGSTGYGGESILARIERSPARERIQVTGYLTDAQLEEFYRRAAILAFPSLGEGFGIPLLEAMAYGLPVLTSNRSALPEVAADAAVLVNPERVEEITDALRLLIGDTRLRGQLIERGFAVAARHSWRQAVQKTWEIYRELL